MAITRAQDNDGYLNGGTTLQIAFPGSVTAGSLLLAFANSYNGGGPGGSFTVSDNNGNSWSEVNDNNYGGNDVLLMAYAMNANSGSTTVSITNSAAGSYTTGVIVEVSGIVTTSALDQSNVNTATATTWNSGNITSTVSNSYAAGVMGHDGGSPSLTEDSPWVLIFEQQNGASSMPISVCEIIDFTGTDAFSGVIGSSVLRRAVVGNFEAAATGPTDYPLSCDAGSYTLTGNAAGLRVGYVLYLEPASALGELTFTGQSASLAKGYVLTCDAGSFAIAGQAADLTVNRQLTVDDGTYTLTGLDADLTYTPVTAYTLTIDAAGSYALTGQAAGLTVTRVLPLDVGAFALTGQAATIAAARALTVDAGTLSLTGQAAGLVADRAIVLAAGAYTLSGQVIGLAKSGEVTAVLISDWLEVMVENVDMESDQFVIALSNTAPGAETTPPTGDGAGVLGNVSEVAYTFVSGNRNITTSSSSQTGGEYNLVLADKVITAAGGSVGPFRYIYVYDDTVTAPADPLVCYYDYGQAVTLTAGDTLTIDFPAAGQFKVVT